MPDLYGMLQPLLAKMAPRPEEDPESIGLPFQSTTGVNVGTTEKYDPQPPAPPPDMGGLPFASTTGVSKGTTVSALGGGNVTATATPRQVAPQAKGDTTSLMQALGSNPPNIAAMQGGMSGGGDISAVPSAAPTSDRVELAPGIWGSRSGAPVGLPSGVPAGAGGMPEELPLPQGPSPYSLMGKTPPDVAALGGAVRKGAPAPIGQAGQTSSDMFNEADAGDVYRKEHYRQHVERFPDGTPVITGTGTPDEHKGFWNRFKHALQGMGLGALSAIGSADPRDPNALGRALGGAIGGGVTAGWNPQNADNLYNRVLVDPEADRLRQKQLINQKVKMEQEEHSNKILDMESLRKAREAGITHDQATTDLNRRKQEWDEKIEPEKIKVERERIEAQERQAGAANTARQRDWSVAPGHLYKDENGQYKVAPYTPQQLDQNGKSLSSSQQWTQYMAQVGSAKARVDAELAAKPPTPNDIIAFAVQNNMTGGASAADGQKIMEILQAQRTPGAVNQETGEFQYGAGKTPGTAEESKAAKDFFMKAEAFFRERLERSFVAADELVRQQLSSGQQRGGAAPPQPGGPARPGTNAKTEGGLAYSKDKLVR